MNIANKVFLISGGASGLGLATARMIIDHGGEALLMDIDDVRGKQSAVDLGDAAHFLNANVTNEESVKNAISEALNKFGHLHGAISCAGIGPAQRVLGKSGVHELDSFSRVIAVNLIGTFNVLRLAAEVMQTNSPEVSGERGVVINTASVAAFDGQIGQAAYAASKGGIVAMTLPIARELARFGIRVMTIAPGIFETPMLENLPEDAKLSLGAQVPFPSRLGRPDEYASLVKQIIENQMLNGEVIRLDGGIRMNSK